MQKITPFLWFDGNAEEAMNFYVSVFKNSTVVSVMLMPGKTTVSSRGISRSALIAISTPYLLTKEKLV